LAGGEPALQQIDPPTVSGCEVDGKARALGEPLPDHRRLVSAVVLRKDMHLQLGGPLRLDYIQELAILTGSMATVPWAHDAAGLQLQRRKPAGRSMALVVLCTTLPWPEP